MTTKHTPRTWEITESGDQLEVMQVDGASVAVILEEKGAMANAHLIAAAPDLLAAARAALIDLCGEETYAEHKETIATLQAAIAKTKGEN